MGTSPNRQPTFTTTVTMGRLHSNGKGISASAIPYSRTPPSWLKTTPEQVVDQICKLAKKGATPSQIGVVLRLPRYRPSQGCHRKQDPQNPQVKWPCTRDPRGPVHVDQEGRRRPQASRAQPQG